MQILLFLLHIFLIMSKTPSIKLNYEEVLEFCEKYNSIEQFINIFCKNDERPNIFFEFSPGLANQKLVFEKEMDRIKKEKLLTFSASKKTNVNYFLLDFN